MLIASQGRKLISYDDYTTLLGCLIGNRPALRGDRVVGSGTQQPGGPVHDWELINQSEPL
jgi:hypothetical protein